jgi:hypothetical protein
MLKSRRILKLQNLLYYDFRIIDILKGIESVRRTIENFVDDFETKNGANARVTKRNKIE